MKHMEGGEIFYMIHEVFYDGKKTGWTECGMRPCGETIKDLKQDLKWMLKAFEAPILDSKTGKEIK